MKGSVQKKRLPSGTVVWQLQLDAGRDENGKRVRISKNFPRKGDADGELARLVNERQEGAVVRPSPKTFRDFMTEWLSEHAEKHCSRKTAERYRQLAEYAIEALGGVPLRDVSTLMLERLYNRLHDTNGKAGKPLSARTVKHVHDTVRCALNTALRWKLLRVNPAVACSLPQIERREARVLEDVQLQWLLDAARGHPWMHGLLVLASASGLRRGELLALRWSDVDFTFGSLTVSKSLEQTKKGLRVKSPKSGKARKLTLPSAAVETLQAHRHEQERLRQSFGADYRKDLDLVFSSPSGEHLKPNTVSPAVCDLAARCGLTGIGLHSLRHTHGSQLLSAGVPLPTVSKRLGHSSVNVTASIYAHAFAADEIAAAEAWELKMGEAVRSSPRIRQ